MKIAVGSKNPVKFNAVKEALLPAFSDVEFLAAEVESGVSNQPMSDEETITGAINRAKNALNVLDTDIGVGLEGGVKETEYGMMSTVWCAIVDKYGKTGLGGGINLHIPNAVAKRIREGMEMGKAMDEITGRENTKHQEGAVGILTKGLIDRKEAYGTTVKFAIVKFLNPDLYQD